MRTKSSVSLPERVAHELASFIAAERQNIESEAQALVDELERLVAAGGKRIRPRVCYWGHIAAGGSDGPEIVRVGAALELLHTFALIHDDVMDRSPLRRSRLSTFRALAELSAGVPHRGDPKRFGTSAAILTGLLGFVLADRLFLTSGFEPDVMQRATDRFDRMRTRTIAGQYLDILAAHRGDADAPTARRIASLKSAGYTVADPLAIGALCAGADERVVDVLDAYGFPLGEAFQLRDDILGTFGETVETGKDRDGDIREGKQTLLLARARDLAGAAERDHLDRVVGNDRLSKEDADRVREIVVSTGALEETDELIAELTVRAKEALDPAVVGEEAAAALTELADEVSKRPG